MESRLVLVHCLLIAVYLVGVKCDLLGGKVVQDPDQPEYKELAQNSLDKYVMTNKLSTVYRVLEMLKVTTQVVAGVLTELDFIALAEDCSSGSDCQLLVCHSEVWDREWENSREIKVHCE